VVRTESSVPRGTVRDALVLAAGNGDRFNTETSRSKLLQPILGQPLILRTLATAYEAGISSFEFVVGYEADAVRSAIESSALPGVSVSFTHNPEWHLENGLSALAARARFGDRRFALLMGDHLFEAKVLARLLDTAAAPAESLLAIDTRPAPPDVAAEATKVRLDGSRIVAIGKDLDEYDALDTGLFVCAPAIFPALDEARRAGDTTLSGGIRRLAALGLMRGVSIGDAAWYDIDTPADLRTAESLLASQPEHA
jgi:choline kinase